MKMILFLLWLPLLSIHAQGQKQPKRERTELSITKIQNLELSYTQTIKKSKSDTTYMVTITMTDVNPITSRSLTLGGNKKEF